MGMLFVNSIYTNNAMANGEPMAGKANSMTATHRMAKRNTSWRGTGRIRIYADKRYLAVNVSLT